MTLWQKNSYNPIHVVALLAREHGLAGLKALQQRPEVNIAAIATHRRLPKSEDPCRSERSDYSQYVQAAKDLGCPLYTVDNLSEQQKLENCLQELSFDLLFSISWRRWIPITVLEQACLGGINLHRGKLPNYPGAEPVRQALQNGDLQITISAHRIEEKIDGGEVLCEVHLTDLPPTHWPISKRVTEIKHSLTPLFTTLTHQSLDRCNCIQQG